MRRFLLILLLFLMSQNVSNAINWVRVETPMGRVAYVDSDSITPYKHYYFYNIMFQNPGNPEFVIMTMQSSKSSPLSARVKAYTEAEYKALNGDYSNITNIVKPNLEPVTYQSVTNTCYKFVKDTMKAQDAQSIIITDEEEIE